MKVCTKRIYFKKKHGMIGDVTIGRNWHTHYSRKDLVKLFGNKFRRKYWVLFTLPILLALDFVYASIFKESKFLIWMAEWIKNKTR